MYNRCGIDETQHPSQLLYGEGKGGRSLVDRRHRPDWDHHMTLAAVGCSNLTVTVPAMPLPFSPLS